MNPKTVLALKDDNNSIALLNEWLEEYDKIAREFVSKKGVCDMLKSRAKRAWELYKEREEYVASPCHDEAYYEEFSKIRDSEDAALDGDFPLGNEKDALFANCFFTIPELAKIQCKLHDLIAVGDFNGYNFDVLVRKGFVAELNGDFEGAVRCYEGVSSSKIVQEREYDCRKKINDENDPHYESERCSARQILQEQIDGGNIDAIWQMAHRCKKENDFDGAAEWFNRAVESGQVDALICAAKVYLDKDGDFYNERLAKNYLRRAADKGSANAIVALGDLELRDTDISFWQQAAKLRDISGNGEKVSRKVCRQHKKQMAWYRLAAKSGDSDSMNALSMAYHLGYPENRDDNEAFIWALRSADCGDGSGMYQAAYFYENGFGTDRDIDAAMLLYAESAEQGVRSSMIRLYEIYTQGLEHIKPDGKAAAHYLWMSGEGRD